MLLQPLRSPVKLSRSRNRSLRYALVGLANGVSLVLLAIVVSAYGPGTTIPLDSIEEFLRIGFRLTRRPSEPTLARALGYIGAALIVLSPLWFLLINPALRGLLDFEFSTTPVERRGEDDGTDQGEEGDERRPTKIAETGLEFVRGGTARGDDSRFEPGETSGEDETEPAGREG
jgi:hypothetical protein